MGGPGFVGELKFRQEGMGVAAVGKPVAVAVGEEGGRTKPCFLPVVPAVPVGVSEPRPGSVKGVFPVVGKAVPVGVGQQGEGQFFYLQPVRHKSGRGGLAAQEKIKEIRGPGPQGDREGLAQGHYVVEKGAGAFEGGFLPNGNAIAFRIPRNIQRRVDAVAV